MAFGEQLRAERERRGLSEHQVAEATHMMVQIVRELEAEDFHRIAAAIYGRGFVKLYATFLELEPKPLVEDFDLMYRQRGRQPEAPTKVALQRFDPPADDSLPPTGRRPDEHTAAARPDGTDRTGAGRTAGQDLFGQPLRKDEAAQGAPDPDGARLSIPRPAGAPSPLLSVEPGTLRPEWPGKGDRPRIHEEPAHAEPVTPSGRPRPPVARSVLDSASHRFDGQPYRPGLGHRLGHLVGIVFGALATVTARLAALLRQLGAAIAAHLRRWLRGARTWPWATIGRAAAIAVPAVVLLWGAAIGLRACSRRGGGDAPDEAAASTPLDVVIERVLPPPAGYYE